MPRPGQYPRLNLRPKGVPKGTRADRVRRAVAAGGTPDGALRLQLDRRTVVTLKNADKLEWWLERYPELRIIKPHRA